jgi:hypothetical protein
VYPEEDRKETGKDAGVGTGIAARGQYLAAEVSRSAASESVR